MSLYQSYRPKNFSDVVGQDFIKKVLANSCKTHTFHHGYIFFGFHGIGKTTLARIFSEGINCTNITTEGNPCHACENCIAYDNGKMIDVIEIDAASYTGVDNIREVIDHAKFTPTQGKYKVYIIDEVHMLSKGAFNALLKTLEEPPIHAIFLLATTEINKIPDTILSRVIRFDLTKIGEADMREHLKGICKKEALSFEEEALTMIIHRSRGSLRDSLTMLEKCIIEKYLTIKNVENALHLVNTTFLKKTFEAIRSGKSTEIQAVIRTLEDESTDIRQFSAQMTEWIVENINEALEQREFPIYRGVFDMFTQIFIQSRQVAVPLDILRMALYEKIQDTIIPIARKTIQIVEVEKNNDIDSVNHILPTPEKELPPVKHILSSSEKESDIPQNKILISNSELPDEKKTPSKLEKELFTIHTEVKIVKEEEPSLKNEGGGNTKDTTSFSKENFLIKIQELGIKSTLIPLLRTAGIICAENELTITTTTFGKSRCEERDTIIILNQAAETFGAKKLVLLTQTTTAEDEEKTEDIVRAIFG